MVDNDDLLKMIYHLNVLKILFMGEGGKQGLLSHIEEKTEGLERAIQRLEESSTTLIDLQLNELQALTRTVAERTTVAVRSSEYDKIEQLVKESLATLSDESAEKAVIGFFDRVRERNSGKREEEVALLKKKNKELLEKTKKLEKYQKRSGVFLKLSVFLSLSLLVMIVFLFSN